jgi:hypothetical protein
MTTAMITGVFWDDSQRPPAGSLSVVVLPTPTVNDDRAKGTPE